MNREEELIQIISEEPALMNLVREAVFLEGKLEELRQLPFIKVNPKNPQQQKGTVAQKQYKELLQQYTNIVKVIAKAAGLDESDEESPLRKWVRRKLEEENLDT